MNILYVPWGENFSLQFFSYLYRCFLLFTVAKYCSRGIFLITGFFSYLEQQLPCSVNFLKRLLFLFYIMVCNQRIEVCFNANKPTLSWVCNLLTYVNPYMEAIIIIPYTKAILVILSLINSKSVKKESAKTSWKCRGTELNSTEQADHNICGLHQWGSSLLSNSMEKLTF